HHWRPHLVARQPEQQEDHRAADQRRDRKGLQRRQDGAGHRAGAVLPFPRTATWPGGDGLSRHPQCRDVFLRRRLKAGGYKIVQMKAKTQFQTLPEYDEALVKDMKLPATSLRPVNSVVQTVSQ